MRELDGNAPMMGKVFHRSYRVQQEIQASDLPAAVRAQVERLWRQRWQFYHHPLHGAGYALDPEVGRKLYWLLCCNWLRLLLARASACRCLSTPFSAWCLKHAPPPFPLSLAQFWGDSGVTGEDECFTNLLKVVQDTYASDAAAAQRARQQYASYKAKEGLFGQAAAEEDAKAMPAWQWWQLYGAGAPELRKVAMRVLSQVASSSACERCWSVYDFIHSARRNRLAPARAEKLVRIYMNLRLVEATSSPFFEERFIDWVEGGTGEI